MRRTLGRFLTIPTLSVMALAGTLPAQALPAPLPGPTGAPGSYTEQNLADTLFGDASNYRIPALADLGDGVVLAAWDGRPNNASDAPNPNSILMRRSTDYGASWSEISYIAQGQLPTAGTKKYGYSDPSFVVDREAGKVFAFFVYSQDQGFHHSEYGNDIANDRNVIGAVVTESSDGGITWSKPRDITPIAKPGTSKANPLPGDVKSTFASSGEGIQLKYGPHKGRLIQQFAGKVKQADGSEAIQAYSLYSDDHGQTWQRGNFVGTGMDENKVVELSDGRVMMNSRDSSNSHLRKVAISSDGGQTWGPVSLDAELPDPTNNASIIRMYPNAPQGSKDAQKLIFTNSYNGANSQRKNLTARVSCDDGQTWPGIRQFQPGFGAYSSATALSNGNYGVLYEASYKTDIRYGTFNQDWLNVVCAPLSAEPVTVEAGQSVNLPVTITNQEDRAISGRLTLADTADLTGNQSDQITLAPGESQTVTLTLTAAAAARSGSIDAVFTGEDGRQSRYSLGVSVSGNKSLGVEISQASAQTRDTVANPYSVGEQVTYNFSVTNTSPETVDVVPVGGNLDTGFLPPAPHEAKRKNCRYLKLAAGAGYSCGTGKHTVTQEDLDRGYFVPELKFSVRATADPSRSQEVTHTGAPVRLGKTEVVPTLAISGQMTSQPQQYYAQGDVIAYSFQVKNESALTLTALPTSSNFEQGFSLPAKPNCRWIGLKPAGTYTCSTARHTLTAQDLERGYFQPEATFTAVSSLDGSEKTFSFTGERIAVPVAPEPETPGNQDPIFRDVKADNMFYTEIQWVAQHGIARGWPDGTYRPLADIERAAMAAYLFRLAGPQDYQAPEVSPFKDVPTSHPFYREIAWMYQAGIARGWEDGTFRPQQSVNRDAMAAFFYRLSGAQGYQAPATSPFTDISTDDIFYTEISWLAEQKISTGWPDGSYRPVQPIKRDAMAAFVYRFDRSLTDQK